MAVLRHFTCIKCGKAKSESVPNNVHFPICWDCSKEKERIERENFLNERSAMTIEERLSLIEQWIYDYKPPININDIRF